MVRGGGQKVEGQQPDFQGYLNQLQRLIYELNGRLPIAVQVKKIADCPSPAAQQPSPVPEPVPVKAPAAPMLPTLPSSVITRWRREGPPSRPGAVDTK